MASLSPSLLRNLRITLLRCGIFTNEQHLQALFVDARINAWANQIPSMNTPDARVQTSIHFLIGQQNNYNQNALVLFLVVLIDSLDPTNACYTKLIILAQQAERELSPPHSVQELSKLGQAFEIPTLMQNATPNREIGTPKYYQFDKLDTHWLLSRYLRSNSKNSPFAAHSSSQQKSSFRDSKIFNISAPTLGLLILGSLLTILCLAIGFPRFALFSPKMTVTPQVIQAGRPLTSTPPASPTNTVTLTSTPTNTSTHTLTPTPSSTTQPLPDLTITNHHVSYFAPCPWDGGGQLTMTVHNIGFGTLLPFITTINGQEISLAGIANGATKDVTISFANGPIGSIDAEVDSDQEIVESNESNNEYRISFTPPPPCTPTATTSSPTPTDIPTAIPSPTNTPSSITSQFTAMYGQRNGQQWDLCDENTYFSSYRFPFLFYWDWEGTLASGEYIEIRIGPKDGVLVTMGVASETGRDVSRDLYHPNWTARDATRSNVYIYDWQVFHMAADQSTVISSSDRDCFYVFDPWIDE